MCLVPVVVIAAQEMHRCRSKRGKEARGGRGHMTFASHAAPLNFSDFNFASVTKYFPSNKAFPDRGRSALL